MRSTLVFLCLVVAVFANRLPETERARLALIHGECQSDLRTNCDENLLRNLAANANNRQVGVHMLCMTVKEGLQKGNGDLNKEVIRSKIELVSQDSSRVDEHLQKCAVKKESPEKTAVALVLCFVQNRIPYYHQL
ncbi:unnamed protein product [Phaedon cochleariae]|uniref:Uncharacterized protein n=1 Tax=Phaedon cochleariae TaxID=80249 RepID=A0A9P0DDD0_PHACE|nr:unnamed protein product [Phaedon cochleariae]